MSSITSVFRQSYKNLELLVINDGSTDNTKEILLHAADVYPNMTILHQANQGPYVARNFALTKAKGKFIAFLDADDYWAPTCLEKLHNALIANHADLCYCGWQNIVENGIDGSEYIPPAYENGDITKAFLKSCPWPIHAALIRRELVDDVHGFSTRSPSSMDYDFWLKVSSLTHNIIRVPEVLAFYRWHQYGQISSVKWKQVLDSWQVRKEFIANHPNLVSHIPKREITLLTDEFLINQAYNAFWKRDLVSSQELFRKIWHLKLWRLKDIPHIIVSFLPYSLLVIFVNLIDKQASS